MGLNSIFPSNFNTCQFPTSKESTLWKSSMLKFKGNYMHIISKKYGTNYYFTDRMCLQRATEKYQTSNLENIPLFIASIITLKRKKLKRPINMVAA